MISAKNLKLTRQIHLYFGVFISPALLFFAFTGALQTFSLHETTQGSTYKPPQWAITLAQLHKKQTTVVPVRKGRPGEGPGPGKPSDGAGAGRPNDAAKDAPKDGARDARPAPQPQTAPAGRPPDNPSPLAKAKSHLPMKIFFLIVSVGLFTSTITGIIMSYKYNSNKAIVTGLLIAGLVLPLLLLPF